MRKALDKNSNKAINLIGNKIIIDQGRLRDDALYMATQQKSSIRGMLNANYLSDSTITNAHSKYRDYLSKGYISVDELSQKYDLPERPGYITPMLLKELCSIFGLSTETYILPEKVMEVEVEEIPEEVTDVISKECTDWLAVIAETLEEMLKLQREDHNLLVQLNNTVSYKKPPVLG